MKEFQRILLFACIAAFLVNCNKGVKDDSFILLTRANQLSQKWNVVSFTVDGEDKLIQNTSFTVNSDSCVNVSVTLIDSALWYFEFEENGSFEENRTTSTYKIWDELSVSPSCNESLTEEVEVTVRERKGLWLFNEDKRKADQIFMYDKEGDYSVLWQIDVLSRSTLQLHRFFLGEEDRFIEEEMILEPY